MKPNKLGSWEAYRERIDRVLRESLEQRYGKFIPKTKSKPPEGIKSEAYDIGYLLASTARSERPPVTLEYKTRSIIQPEEPERPSWWRPGFPPAMGMSRDGLAVHQDWDHTFYIGPWDEYPIGNAFFEIAAQRIDHFSSAPRGKRSIKISEIDINQQQCSVSAVCAMAVGYGFHPIIVPG